MRPNIPLILLILVGLWGTNGCLPFSAPTPPPVLPGGTVGPFIFDAKSPNKEGTYVMVFKLQGGFCYPYVRIVVRP
jgi:hypothetical protein